MSVDLPPLRYLAAADVLAAMPPIDERLRLAERTLVALATPGTSQLPPKIAIHPRPHGSFAHAMPAHLRDDGADASPDLVGMKWVAGFPANNERGLPSINALVVLNDASTGVPRAILDGGHITALRTAAVSGVAIRGFGPSVTGRARRAVVVGAGVQGRSHLPVLGHLLPGVEVTVVDRHSDRAQALVDSAATTDGIGLATVSDDLRAALAGADVVVTAVSFTTPERRQSMTPDWLPDHALTVAVDYATLASASLATAADLFLVDERGQFIANREAGNFDGYPEPTMTLGEAILRGTPRPAGRVLVTHLGVGLADVVFAAAILERADAAGLGQVLPR